jgi:hypothetical protein
MTVLCSFGVYRRCLAVETNNYRSGSKGFVYDEKAQVAAVGMK